MKKTLTFLVLFFLYPCLLCGDTNQGVMYYAPTESTYISGHITAPSTTWAVVPCPVRGWIY
ncbi:hypothetical protein JXI42_10150 [bacterium]|nr:hypothetical protein [bacterium]